MVDLQQIKEKYAREKGYCEWSDIIYGEDDPAIVDDHFDEVAKRYGEQMYNQGVKDALNS